jgi:hypothetical protein
MFRGARAQRGLALKSLLFAAGVVFAHEKQTGEFLRVATGASNLNVNHVISSWSTSAPAIYISRICMKSFENLVF